MFKMHIPWPLPAVLSWVFAWIVFYAVMQMGWSRNSAFVLAVCLSIVCSFSGTTWWRKAMIIVGYPVSFLLMHSSGDESTLFSWMWLLPFMVLLVVYPVKAWKDAPFFPTPMGSLDTLNKHIHLADNAKVLDAGCGLGHGLMALRKEYPAAQLAGVEWSWFLYGLCRLRCPWALIYRSDLWAESWSDVDMVYLFQRPESMHKATQKALRELKPGAWMVSLEFEAIELVSKAEMQISNGKMLWLYQAPLKPKISGD